MGPQGHAHGPEGHAPKLNTEQGQNHAIFERGIHDVLPHAKAQVAREVYIQESFAAKRCLPHEDGQKTAIIAIEKNFVDIQQCAQR